MEEFLLRVLRATSFDHCDAIWRRTYGEYAPDTIFVQCNDVFWWATADLEQITPTNITEFEKAIADVASIDDRSYEGPILFCARVRKCRPMRAYYRDLKKEIAALFDACGPAMDE